MTKINKTSISTPILYILMRNDMASLNSGKAMAQAAHAANAFTFEAEKILPQAIGTPFEEYYTTWINSTSQGFGTTITLAVPEAVFKTIKFQCPQKTFENKIGLAGIADVILDPTYPLVDGQTLHLIPVETCAYVFGDKYDLFLKSLLGSFPLHP